MLLTASHKAYSIFFPRIHPNNIHSRLGGDEERFPVPATETEIGRFFGNLDVFEFLHGM